VLLEAAGEAKEGHQLLVSGVDAVEAGRAGGIASGIARRLSRSVRSVAESGYLQAIKAMSEVVTWWASKREKELEQKGYSLQRTDRTLVAYASELAKHTRHVLPISVQADVLHRAELPVIPPDLLAQLRAMAPTPDAVAALEDGNTTDAEVIEEGAGSIPTRPDGDTPTQDAGQEDAPATQEARTHDPRAHAIPATQPTDPAPAPPTRQRRRPRDP